MSFSNPDAVKRSYNVKLGENAFASYPCESLTDERDRVFVLNSYLIYRPIVNVDSKAT